METSGAYVIVNRTDKPITTLHVRFVRDLIIDRLDIPGAHLQAQYRGLQLPHLRPRCADAAGRVADDDLRHHLSPAGVPQQRQRARHRRQRDLRQRHDPDADHRHGSAAVAAGPRQAAQVRPAARTAHAQAGNAGRRPGQLHPPRQRLDHRGPDRHHRRRPGPRRPGLPDLGDGEGRPPDDPLRHRLADPALLLRPVGPLHGLIRQIQGRRHRRLLRPPSTRGTWR